MSIIPRRIDGQTEIESLSIGSTNPNQSVQTNSENELVSVANTGTGKNVLQTSPALITPTLGVASCTSMNIPTITNLSTLNNVAFNFSTGTFSPTFTTTNPDNDVAFSNEINITYTRRIGKWVRIGNLAIVYFDVAFTCDNLYNLLSIALQKGVPFTPETGTIAPYSGPLDLGTINPFQPANNFQDNWYKMEPITLGGTGDGQAWSVYNGVTQRWEQRAVAEDVFGLDSLKEYFYVNGAGPPTVIGRNDYRILFTCTFMIA